MPTVGKKYTRSNRRNGLAFTEKILVDDYISALICQQMKAMIINLPCLEEVKNVIFSLNTNGAPRSNGLEADFFQHYQEIIGNDVFKDVLQFLSILRFLIITVLIR